LNGNSLLPFCTSGPPLNFPGLCKFYGAWATLKLKKVTARFAPVTLVEQTTMASPAQSTGAKGTIVQKMYKNMFGHIKETSKNVIAYHTTTTFNAVTFSTAITFSTVTMINSQRLEMLL
jgi:hypothetical protein